MDQKLKYSIMFFYSDINQISLKTRGMINNFMKAQSFPIKITIQEVNYDQDKNLSQQYGIMGTPAIIFFKNGEILRKHFGEMTTEEFKIILENILSI